MLSPGSVNGFLHPEPVEVALSLQSVDELFSVPDGSMFSSTGRIQSGVDELVQELTPRRLGGGVRLRLSLPPEQAGAATEVLVRAALERYCALRERQTELRLRAQTRDGLAAIPAGLVIFVLGLIGSALLQKGVPETVQILLGDGALLVIAWVGLWYPLDMLVHYRRPIMLERRVMQAIADMEVVVVAEGAEPGPAPATAALP